MGCNEVYIGWIISKIKCSKANWNINRAMDTVEYTYRRIYI